MKPLEWVNGNLRFLDQTKLPNEEFFHETNNVDIIADAIRRLAIRGAPLIGIAAAYGVAVASFSIDEKNNYKVRNKINEAINLFASTRPTAVNLFWALERQQKILNGWNSSITELRSLLLNEAIKIHNEDAEMCEKISLAGVNLLPENCCILTHCNSGILATGGRGTAIGIITKAWERKKLKHVYIDETRPLLQGARLTAWEMNKNRIPATLIADNTAAVLMKQKKIDVIIVGADRIALNGDTANKIGTYNLAILAQYHNIPFYVAAPVSTIDSKINNGNEIPIEERNANELKEINGLNITVKEIGVYSPAFDFTPYELISAIITDKGIIHPPFCNILLDSDKVENK